MAVYFKCKACDEEHPMTGPFLPKSKVALDMHVYISDLKLECPTTGTTERYRKEDLVWRDG